MATFIPWLAATKHRWQSLWEIWNAACTTNNKQQTTNNKQSALITNRPAKRGERRAAVGQTLDLIFEQLRRRDDPIPWYEWVDNPAEPEQEPFTWRKTYLRNCGEQERREREQPEDQTERELPKRPPFQQKPSVCVWSFKRSHRCSRRSSSHQSKFDCGVNKKRNPIKIIINRAKRSPVGQSQRVERASSESI